MAIDYLKRILNARVYDVARETELEVAPVLSKRLGNTVLFKREDNQPVFSFKLRGAYNKMAGLSAAELARGVIAASAGNHAQGVALSAQRLGCRAVIVMPVTTPQVKIDAVEARGAEVVLAGESYSDAYAHALDLQAKGGLCFVHPFDDPDVIAGQGTIGMEILRQHQALHSDRPIHAIFVAIGGGGLISGVAAYVKAVRPEIRIIGVQTVDSDAMAQSVATGRRVTLANVGLFSDGTAVKQVGVETLRLVRKHVDEIVLVDTDAICAAIKDVFVETRSILEPAGALSIAGLKAYAAREKLKGETLVAIACGANMNFDRLRFVADRAEVGEEREAVFAVTIPEERGSFRRFCELVGTARRDRVQLSHRRCAGRARVRRHRRQGARREREARDRVPQARLRIARSHARRTREDAPAPHDRRPLGARRRRAHLPVRVPRATRRADALPVDDEPELEHQPVPLPQPGRATTDASWSACRCRPANARRSASS